MTTIKTKKYRNYIVTLLTLAFLVGGVAIQAWAQSAPKFLHTRSSGLFALPENAHSVDWSIVNDSTVPQTFRVTVYKVGVGEKTVVAPGPLTLTEGPNFGTHNANSVGVGLPFQRGHYYEVVVESNSRRVLPSVQV